MGILALRVPGLRHNLLTRPTLGGCRGPSGPRQPLLLSQSSRARTAGSSGQRLAGLRCDDVQVTGVDREGDRLVGCDGGLWGEVGGNGGAGHDGEADRPPAEGLDPCERGCARLAQSGSRGVAANGEGEAGLGQPKLGEGAAPPSDKCASPRSGTGPGRMRDNCSGKPPKPRMDEHLADVAETGRGARKGPVRLCRKRARPAIHRRNAVRALPDGELADNLGEGVVAGLRAAGPLLTDPLFVRALVNNFAFAAVAAGAALTIGFLIACTPGSAAATGTTRSSWSPPSCSARRSPPFFAVMGASCRTGVGGVGVVAAASSRRPG